MHSIMKKVHETCNYLTIGYAVGIFVLIPAIFILDLDPRMIVYILLPVLSATLITKIIMAMFESRGLEQEGNGIHEEKVVNHTSVP